MNNYYNESNREDFEQEMYRYMFGDDFDDICDDEGGFDANGYFDED